MALGRHVFGLAAILAGVVALVFRDFWAPAPAHLPMRQLMAMGGDVLLLAGGIGINLERRMAGAAALGLAAFFAASFLVMDGAAVLHRWNVWGTWEGTAEPVALCMGCLIAWSLLGAGSGGSGVARVARLVFGLCLVVFGVAHFVYLNLTAPLVPHWLPPSQTFWAYATGLAQIAAGLAMLSGVQARLAAILLTAMYVGFGLLVHIPAVIHRPHDYGTWTEHDVNLLLVGAAWILADSLMRSTSRKGRRGA
jgi:uncharacterized membrane protein YphA (DoxX/SURF4 family)